MEVWKIVLVFYISMALFAFMYIVVRDGGSNTRELWEQLVIAILWPVLLPLVIITEREV